MLHIEATIFRNPITGKEKNGFRIWDEYSHYYQDNWGSSPVIAFPVTNLNLLQKIIVLHLENDGPLNSENPIKQLLEQMVFEEWPVEINGTEYSFQEVQHLFP